MSNKYKKVLLILMTLALAAACMVMAAGCSKGSGKESSEETAQEQPKEKTAEESAEQSEKEKTEERTEEEGSKVNTDNITINTQSSIRIEGSKTIYIDPYKRSEATHDADMILITHAHYDHFDAPSLRNVASDDTFVICPDSMYDDVKSLGLGKGEIASMEPVAKIKPGARFGGITIKAVPAYNLNKNFHPKANGWLGYVITMDGVTYYAAGDTDALPELEDVKCDIAFVPIGGTYTMTPEEAAGLVNNIKPEIAVPIHYGTIVGRAEDADTFGLALNKDIKMVKKVEDAK